MRKREVIEKEILAGEVWHVLKAILEVVLDIRDRLSKSK